MQAMPRRLLQLYAGLVLYGLSMALQVRATLGLGPWDVFHQGVADHTGLSFGTVVIITSVARAAAVDPAAPEAGDRHASATCSSSASRPTPALALIPEGGPLGVRLTMLAAGGAPQRASPARPTSARASARARATG